MTVRDRRWCPLFSFGHHCRTLVGVELVDAPCLAKSPPHFLHDFHLVERHVQRIGSGAYCIDHGLPRSVCCSPCFLAGNARRLGGDPGVLRHLDPTQYRAFVQGPGRRGE